MITPAQCRAARALLNWNQQELANWSGVSAVSIRNFEIGKTRPQKGTLKLLYDALEQGGVRFIPGNGDGPGVRSRGDAIRSNR